MKQPQIEHTEEYKQGYQAYEHGEDSRTCPFMKNSTSHDKWMRGWNDAKDDAEEEYNDRG